MVVQMSKDEHRWKCSPCTCDLVLQLPVCVWAGRATLFLIIKSTTESKTEKGSRGQLDRREANTLGYVPSFWSISFPKLYCFFPSPPHDMLRDWSESVVFIGQLYRIVSFTKIHIKTQNLLEVSTRDGSIQLFFFFFVCTVLILQL